VLKKGNFADVVVLNPETIKENTTYAQPHQLSDGVETLIVNGTLTIKDSKLTGERNGKFLD
jgi:N-acyl-D-aspartate/D-glutamate deacylase